MSLGEGVSRILWQQYLSLCTKKRDDGGRECQKLKLRDVIYELIRGPKTKRIDFKSHFFISFSYVIDAASVVNICWTAHVTLKMFFRRVKIIDNW